LVAAIVLSGAVVGAKQAISQTITEFPLPTPGSNPAGITAGPDGALWFTETGANKIGRITTTGEVTEFPLPEPNSYPFCITVGPDGALWFTEQLVYRIGRITTDGAITEFPLPTFRPTDIGNDCITTGPDGALWLTGQYGNMVLRITTAGGITVFPLPTHQMAPPLASPPARTARCGLPKWVPIRLGASRPPA
jgi:virginiamycin B lyase